MSVQLAPLAVPQTSIEGWQSVQLCDDPEASPCSVSFGVKVAQNGRNTLEDTYAAHLDFVNVCSASAPSSCDGSDRSSWDACSLARSSLSSASSSSSQADQDTLSYFGVFDGHGGVEAAQHCSQRLHQNFSELLAAAHAADAAERARNDASTISGNGDMERQLSLHTFAGPGRGLGPSVCTSSADNSSADPGPADAGSAESTATAMDLDPPGTPGSGAPAAAPASTAWQRVVPGTQPSCGLERHASLEDKNSQNICEALKQAFIKTDAELAGTEVGEVVGSTAVVAVVGKNEVYVAHCGDSRAVLCRKATAVSLTADHKPDRKDEAARVAASGGKVLYKGGSYRVMGLLAMSRAIGDHFLRPFVIPEPEVTCFQRSNDDELLILATDGLWDVFSNHDATHLALRSMQRARERGASRTSACRVGASVLTKAAIERGSRDNITVVVVDLRRPEQPSLAAVLASQCSGEPTRRAGVAHAAAHCGANGQALPPALRRTVSTASPHTPVGVDGLAAKYARWHSFSTFELGHVAKQGDAALPGCFGAAGEGGMHAVVVTGPVPGKPLPDEEEVDPKAQQAVLQGSVFGRAGAANGVPLLEQQQQVRQAASKLTAAGSEHKALQLQLPPLPRPPSAPQSPAGVPLPLLLAGAGVQLQHVSHQQAMLPQVQEQVSQ